MHIEKAPAINITEPFSHAVVDAIKKFRLHPSIIKIGQMIPESNTFEFRPFEPREVWDEINRLDTTKKTSGDLPTQILKSTSDLAFSAVTKLANEMVQQHMFPDKLKLADVSPVFNSGDTTAKKNYRPITV